MKKRKFYTCVCAMLLFSVNLSTYASDRKEAIVSKGDIILNRGNTELNITSADLIDLADVIDILEKKYDNGIVSALENVGTFITKDNPNFEELMSGISHSQDIKTLGQTVYVDIDGSKTDDTSLTEKKIQGALARNLSVGTAAWVDGTYIEGTGYDNAIYYNKGITFADNRVNKSSKSYKQGVLDTKVGTVPANYVLTGYTFTNSTQVGIKGTMTNNSGWKNTPTTEGTVNIPKGYHDGSGYVDTNKVYKKGVSDTKKGNATVDNVLDGITFTSANGVSLVGTMPNKGEWTNTPTSKGKVTIPKGYHNGSGYVDTTKVYELGVTDTKKGTAKAENVLTGYTFTNSSGVAISGTMPNKGAWTNTPTKSTKVIIPKGYHDGKGYVDTATVYTNGYNAGIVYADGRANPDSVNYKTGYNAGISYADNRINKSSASYKQGVIDADNRENKDSYNWKCGYNAGIAFADGRVNKSSKSYTQGVTDADARVNKSSKSYIQGLADGKASVQQTITLYFGGHEILASETKYGPDVVSGNYASTDFGPFTVLNSVDPTIFSNIRFQGEYWAGSGSGNYPDSGLVNNDALRSCLWVDFIDIETGSIIYTRELYGRPFDVDVSLSSFSKPFKIQVQSKGRLQGGDPTGRAYLGNVYLKVRTDYTG